MALGPVELLVIRLPGNRFRGEIVPALGELVESGTIRIIDFLFVKKDAAGVVTAVELNDVEPETYALLDPLVADVEGLLAEDDVQRFAAVLEPGSSVGMMLFENVWATRFRDAVVRAKGELVLNERVPKAVVDELVAARTAVMSGA
jgi:Family of unknown function (DUF6325)